MKKTEWDSPKEEDEPKEEKQVCQKCGNDTFRVYIKIIIDDARLYCAKCGEPLW
jgi:ribosomal protein S27AE